MHPAHRGRSSHTPSDFVHSPTVPLASLFARSLARGRPRATTERAAGDWRIRAVRHLKWADLVICVVVMFAAQFSWLGFGNVTVDGGGTLLGLDSYWTVSATVAIAWYVVLGATGARDFRIVANTVALAKRVVTASLMVFGGVAIVGFLLRLEASRGYLLAAMPIGIGSLLIARWAWREWLRDGRKRGRFETRAIAVGCVDAVAELARELDRRGSSGIHLMGACVPGALPIESTTHDLGRPVVGDRIPGTTISVLGDVDSATEMLERERGDTLVVAGATELTGSRVRELGWRLDAERHSLVLAPSLVDVVGPRLHMVPVDGLPLIAVELPRFSGSAQFVKRAVDIVASAIGLVVLSLPTLAIAVAIKRGSPGPVFFMHERIGLDGTPFKMFKFRTMTDGAASQFETLAEGARDAGNTVQFKLTNDPRVTRIGAFLRRYSIDEVPQLINVLKGDMSLVGPRPHVTREVEQYDEGAGRRLLVKPGMTGLWQVSGRSDLSWGDSVRLDLFYVENWTLMTDPLILWRTIRVVLKPEGAY